MGPRRTVLRRKSRLTSFSLVRSGRPVRSVPALIGGRSPLFRSTHPVSGHIHNWLTMLPVPRNRPRPKVCPNVIAKFDSMIDPRPKDD
jgi:hypothetical protein